MTPSFAVRAVSVAATALLGVGLAAPTAQAAPKKPPTPVITSAPAAFTNQTSATVTFTNAATATAYCSLDGAKATVCTSPVSYSKLAVGGHTFAVYAKVGKFKSGLASRSWSVDLTAPATPTLSQPASPTKLATYSISFSSASADVDSYRCSLDGAVAATCTSPAAGGGLTAGFHRLSVQAVDRAGNVSSPGVVTWTVDTSTPAPTISSGPPTVTNSTGATFTFASAEAGVSFTCARDTNTFTACTSPKTYAGLGIGTHDFRVRATDAAGNVATSVTYTWKIQAAAVPALAWSDPPGLPGSVTKQPSATFAFTATGATSLSCLLVSVAQASCVSPASVTGLADGAHEFTLLADSGLSTQTPLTYRWTVDTVAPTAPVIEAPTGTVASSSALIIVTPGAVEDVVTCQLDGTPVGCATAFTATGLSDGPHHVSAVASDTAGNSTENSASWVVDTTPPSVSFTAPTTLTGPVVADFDEGVAGVSTTSVLLTDETGATVATTQTCREALSAPTSCGGTSVAQVLLTPTDRLVPGQHYVATVNPPANATVTDAVGNVATESSLAWRGSLAVAETSPASAWTWRTVKTSKAKGGQYLTESRKGASASWTFSGRSVAWITSVGPTQGKATVLVDDVAKASVNDYSRSTKYGVQRVVKGLAKGKHTITVVATGKKGARAGRGSSVVVDAFRVGKKLTLNPVVTAKWQRVATAKTAGGGYCVAALKGQTVRFTFRGTGFTWLTATGKAYGRAALVVDGVKSGTYDNYSAVTTWQVARPVAGLSDGLHTVVVKVLGSKNAKATGTSVVVDGFVVS